MQTSTLKSVLDHLRRQAGGEAIADISDAELLDRFCRWREETAFALLVQRHGPTVLTVCRNVLGDVHAVEDAFQTTFLVLVRKAGWVRKGDSLGSFLYGVAYRTAARVRAETAERHTRERARITASASAGALEAMSRAETCAALHEEMARLPDKLRLPLVLCYLEGKTHEQAAREMAWPKSSVPARLKRGCELLRQRLSQRGIALSAGVATVLLADEAAKAVPDILTLCTVRAAGEALAGKAVQGAVTARRCALAAMVLTIGLVAAGVGVLASGPTEPKAEQPQQVTKPAEEAKAPAVAPALTDVYGDPLPDGALGRLGTARLRHANVHQVVFSTDGKTLLSTGDDNFLRRWDLSSGKLAGAKFLPYPPNEPTDVYPILSLDGKTFARIGMTRVFLFEVETGKELQRWDTPELEHRLAFTAYGKQLMVRAQTGELLVFDVATGNAVETGLPENARCNRAALDPAGQLLATDMGTGVTLWDIAGRKQLHTIPMVGNCDTMVFSPNGKQLLLFSYKNQKAAVWNTATGEKEAEYSGGEWLTNRFCFSPDGSLIAVASIDNVVLLDAKTMKEVRKIARWRSGAFQFSPDGKTLAGFGGSAVHLWNVADGKPLLDYAGHDRAWQLVYSPDGKFLATGGDGLCHIWDLATKKPTTTVRMSGGHGGWTQQINVFSRDGTQLFGDAWFGTVKAWNVADGKEIATFLTADDEKSRGLQNITSLRLSPDGKRLTACSWDPDVKNNFLVTWDVATQKRVEQSEWPGEWGMAIGPDGKHLTYSKDGKRVLYDFGTKESRTLGGFSWFSPCSFSSDDAILSFLTHTGKTVEEESIRVVQTANGKVLVTLPPGTGAIHALTPDGRFIFTAERAEFRLWEIATGKPALRHAVKTDIRNSITSFANRATVAPDGRSAATSMLDANVIIWDLLPSSRLRVALTPQDVESLWSELANEDAAKAYEAGGRLLTAPSMVCAFLDKHLNPPSEPKGISDLITALDDNEFAKRDAARKALQKLGKMAEPELRRTLDSKPSAETRHVVQALLDDIDMTVLTAEERQQLRAVWVLEQIGSTDARKTLERLAGGTARARQTRDATEALVRLKAKDQAN